MHAYGLYIFFNFADNATENCSNSQSKLSVPPNLASHVLSSHTIISDSTQSGYQTRSSSSEVILTASAGAGFGAVVGIIAVILLIVAIIAAVVNYKAIRKRGKNHIITEQERNPKIATESNPAYNKIGEQNMHVSES